MSKVRSCTKNLERMLLENEFEFIMKQTMTISDEEMEEWTVEEGTTDRTIIFNNFSKSKLNRCLEWIDEKAQNIVEKNGRICDINREMYSLQIMLKSLIGVCEFKGWEIKNWKVR